ncbi:MAG: VWA domain-containing protein, partial [Acidobacteriaceae bacterium]|nr:VWA domain-containing protein [Acidobacteriaceae bacterium]
FAQEAPVTFKSDVALARVDAQVLDRGGRAVTGLEASDFVLRVDGRVVPIRNFASENMPIDILLLLDVSGSMQPHIERISSAAQQALDVLAAKDRVSIMVFDTNTRLRLPFRASHTEITAELNRLLRSERFNGGTHITHALLEAASYVQREARPDARRAMVILTDDETQDSEDEPRVENALAQANAVLSFLQAPYEPPVMNGGGRRPRRTRGGGGWPGAGTGWPGGGGVGFPGGGPVILGRGGPGGYGGDPSHTAGTATIAGDSGGDTIRVDEASALEDTLARLRQRYTFNFYFPPNVAERAAVHVDLSQEARIRYMDAELHSRQVFVSAQGSGEHSGPTVITRSHVNDAANNVSGSDGETTAEPSSSGHRRVAVNEESGPRVNLPSDDSDPSIPHAQAPASQGTPPSNTQAQGSQNSAGGGWPRTHQDNPNPQ